MNKPQGETIYTPLREDKGFIYNLVKGLYQSRIAILALLIICLCLIFIIFKLQNKPPVVTVIDRQSGWSYTTTGASRVSGEILEQQLIYYSREFCENFLNMNFGEIKDARLKALTIMHPALSNTLPVSFKDDNTVRECMETRTTCQFEWSIKPVVTIKNDPYYTTFCQLKRIINKPGFQSFEEIYNIKLNWGRLKKNFDPFTRPHSLTLLKFEELNKDSKELIEQLNLTK